MKYAFHVHDSDFPGREMSCLEDFMNYVNIYHLAQMVLEAVFRVRQKTGRHSAEQPRHLPYKGRRLTIVSPAGVDSGACSTCTGKEE